MRGGQAFLNVGRCRIDPTADICAGAVLGKNYRPLIGFSSVPESTSEETVIGPKVYVGYYTVIGAGSVVEEGSIVDDFSIVECDVVIGQRTLVTYRAQICNDAQIGRNCVIGALIGERVKVGMGCRIFGEIIHAQHNPQIEWDAPEAQEGAAVIGDNAFVGFRAVVVGAVRLGAGAYVCAGAIVTRDVPPGHIVSGVNKIVSPKEWRGVLGGSGFFGR